MLSITKRENNISARDNNLKFTDNFNLRAIDELGLIDSGFGFFAALASILKLDENDDSIDKIEKVIINSRQIMSLQESFCGIGYGEKDHDLYNISKPEHILYEGIIHTHFIYNLTPKVFGPLTPKFFKNKGTYIPKTNSFRILKNNNINLREPIFLDEILNRIRKPSNIKRNTLADPDERPFYNRVNFKKRAEFTSEIHNLFLKKKTIDKIRENKHNIIQTAQYVENENFGLVGIARKKISRIDRNNIKPSKHGFQTCLYFMYHYTLKKDKSLDLVYKDLNHLLPNLLEWDKKVYNILLESSQLCNPPGKEYYIQKVVVRIPNTKKIFALFCVFFSRDIIRNHQEYEIPHSRLNEFLEEFNNNLVEILRKKLGDDFEELVGDKWKQIDPTWKIYHKADFTAHPLNFNIQGDKVVP